MLLDGGLKDKAFIKVVVGFVGECGHVDLLAIREQQHACAAIDILDQCGPHAFGTFNRFAKDRVNRSVDEEFLDIFNVSQRGNVAI